MSARLTLALSLALCAMPPASASIHTAAMRQYAFHAAPAPDEYAACRGRGMTLNDCLDRLASLEAALQAQGYVPRRELVAQNGTQVLRRARPGTGTAVVARMDTDGAAHGLEVMDFAWTPRWNELHVPW